MDNQDGQDIRHPRAPNRNEELGRADILWRPWRSWRESILPASPSVPLCHLASARLNSSFLIPNWRAFVPGPPVLYCPIKSQGLTSFPLPKAPLSLIYTKHQGPTLFAFLPDHTLSKYLRGPSFCIGRGALATNRRIPELIYRRQVFPFLCGQGLRYLGLPKN